MLINHGVRWLPFSDIGGDATPIQTSVSGIDWRPINVEEGRMALGRTKTTPVSSCVTNPPPCDTAVAGEALVAKTV